MKEKIGCCGLVCEYCSAYKNKECLGCREKEDKCKVCECVITKGLRGCWECDYYPCEGKEFYGGIRSQAFIKCAKEEGVEVLEKYLEKNDKKGIKYHTLRGSDYDQFDSVEGILESLRDES